MKKIFFMVLALPLLITAQTKKKVKPAIPVKNAAAVQTKPIDGFIINGEVTGFTDGTTVALLNGQTGAAETEKENEPTDVTQKEEPIIEITQKRSVSEMIASKKIIIHV